MLDEIKKAKRRTQIPRERGLEARIDEIERERANEVRNQRVI